MQAVHGEHTSLGFVYSDSAVKIVKSTRLGLSCHHPADQNVSRTSSLFGSHHIIFEFTFHVYRIPPIIRLSLIFFEHFSLEQLYSVCKIPTIFNFSQVLSQDNAP